jgi:hypothetical protein
MELTILMPCLNEAFTVEPAFARREPYSARLEFPRLTGTAELKGMRHEYC